MTVMATIACASYAKKLVHIAVGLSNNYIKPKVDLFMGGVIVYRNRSLDVYYLYMLEEAMEKVKKKTASSLISQSVRSEISSCLCTQIVVQEKVAR